MKSIDNKLISVVIQGPVFRNGSGQESGDLLCRAIDSIHQHLPEAEIIISTWYEQNVAGMDDVHIIQSHEPDPIIDCTGDLNNINRQLRSTQLGIQAASRPYVLKFRADHYLSSAAIAQIAPPTSYSKYRFFPKPITITNCFIRNPLKVPFLFHLSDLIMFGQKEDLLDIWQQPLVDPAQLVMPEEEQFRILGNYRSRTSMRHVPEQSLTLGWLAKRGLSICLPYCSYTSWPLFALWEQILIANFHMIDHEGSGIVFPQRFTRALYGKRTVYNERDLVTVKSAIGNWRHKMRYMELWFNKYCLAWVRLQFLMSMASHLFFALSPDIEKKVRYYYRKIKGINRVA